MKNFDLKWAREWAGLSQVEAAEKMGVHKQTWNRWESGTHPTPPGVLKRLKELTAMPPEVEASRLRYDKEGYPRSHPRARFEEEAEARGEEWSLEVEEAALEEIEGDEHEDRARERYRLLMLSPPAMSADFIAKELERYDAETERWKKQVQGAERVG